MKMVGIQYLVEFVHCDHRTLRNKIRLEIIMINAVRAMKAHVIHVYFHEFSPPGVSGVVILAESHLTLHTWPNKNYAAVDLFFCGDHVDPRKGFVYLQKKFRAKDLIIRKIARGIPHQTK